MTPSDDLSPQRRPLFFPVVIATVFLTIIGLTAGFVLGERRNNASGGGPVETATAVGGGSSPTPTGKPCPPQAIAKAAELRLPTDLRQVMKIVTDNGTTVWICVDPVGGFYYQSKTGGIDAELKQGVNGLFLSQVERLSSSRFVGTSHEGNVFTVSRTRFEVDFRDAKRADQENAVVAWE